LENRVAELRRERDLTQEELADALEVSRQTISSIENGRYNPSLELAFRIAGFFGLAIEEIFIYARAKEEGRGFAEKYRALLADTALMTVEDLARKHLGADLTKPDFWEAAVKLTTDDVEEFLRITE
jgi:DNA-binding XRE family transcriptional regulator